MIKNSNKFIKATKIILIICSVFVIQKVNMVNLNDKITNENLNKTIDLTGYGANCPLCSGKLGCTGQDVSDGTTIYNDADYGNVRIVASSKNLKCGSIVTFDADYVSGEKVVAIVLDRGVLGTDLDLLVESEDFASKNFGRHKISYDVLRNGWER